MNKPDDMSWADWENYDLPQYDALVLYLKWLIGTNGWTIGLGGR